MGYKVDNAIIMAAGMSSRFAPISYEHPKALITVKGEVLIERQIQQLQKVGISEIIVVVGYMKEQFFYLKEKYGVIIVENPEYDIRNNNSTIYAVRNYLKNSYICSADNYFSTNPFEEEVEEAYYSAVFADGRTNEWCLTIDESDWIKEVTISGENQWYMLGHAFWSDQFSRIFVEILENEYNHAETKDKLWEAIYLEHLDILKLKIRRYSQEDVYEFDSLDELRQFDETYKNVSGSAIMAEVAHLLDCQEKHITNILPEKETTGEVKGFSFECKEIRYVYNYLRKKLTKGDDYYDNSIC